MEYNEIIKALREDNDLTQTALGKILNVNQITISQYERGIRQLNPNMIIAYAKYFNVSTDYILGLTKDPTPNWTNKKVLPPMKSNTIENILNNNTGNIGDVNITQK